MTASSALVRRRAYTLQKVSMGQSDVNEGRKQVNYSEWDRPQKEAKESAETVEKGTMPPGYYVILHPQAKLSSAERQALVGGLGTIFGLGDRGKREDREEHEKEVRNGEREEFIPSSSYSSWRDARPRFRLEPRCRSAARTVH